MLKIQIRETEYYDAKTEEFIIIPGATLELEHSLVAISKWESKWEKAFLGPSQKTSEEILDYVKCMNLGDTELTDLLLSGLTNADFEKVTNYIQSKQTATFIKRPDNKPPSREIVTSELIYYWMISFNIPFECQYWHLNRLLTLVEVCNVKNTPPKKQKPRDILARNASLNAARKKAMNTSG